MLTSSQFLCLEVTKEDHVLSYILWSLPYDHATYRYGILYEDIMVRRGWIFLSVLANSIHLPKISIPCLTVQMGTLGYTYPRYVMSAE